MVYRYSVNSDWGDIFGLKSTDLTEEQLKKISFSKLIELSNQDWRAEKLAGDKLVNGTIEDIKCINRLKEDELTKLPYILLQYNKCIRERHDILKKEEDKCWAPKRTSYILWHMLDKSNKAKEFARWIDGKPSIIETNKINYPWLYDNYPWLANQTVLKILKDSYRDTNSAIRLIQNLPEEPIKRYISQIFKCNKNIFVHSLSNIYTPRKYVIRALREIAGKKKVPKLRVILDQSMLLELPPVMRLKVLESLLVYMRQGKVSFSDITNEEELKPLLFGTAIKHNSRVQVVVKRFKLLCT